MAFCGNIRKDYRYRDDYYQYNDNFLPDIIDYDCKESREKEIALELLRGLNKFREEGTFCDVTLRVGEKTIRAHKNVISVSSPYFLAMFSGNFLESDQQEIRMEEIDADSLEKLIDYMYTAKLDIDSENVKDLLLTASFLQLTKAEKLCCTFIERKFTMENCMEYILFASRNSIENLLGEAIDYASHWFPYIFRKNEYLELEFEELKKLTLKFKQFFNPEDSILSFVMRWINHSHETRIRFIEELLDVLDPLIISPNVLNSSEIPCTSNPAHTAWVARAYKTHSLNELDDHILVSRRIGTFYPLRIKLFSKTAKHRQIKKLYGDIADGSYVCNGYYIYHQGGWMSGKLVDESHVYHPLRCRWISFVPLLEARAYHRSCVLNEKIYSVGGSNGLKALPSIEYTDLYTGQRGFTDPLPRAKERAGLGLHGNSIYVVGGCDRGKSYESIHRFDAREGVWQELAPSPYRAGASTCAVLGDSIYTTHPDTLQRYDIRANEWTMISTQYKRYPPEIFVLDNTLFGLFNDDVAKFIPEGGGWESQRTLHLSLPYLQVSTNLLFPNVKEEEIRDSVFEGFVKVFDVVEDVMETDHEDEGDNSDDEEEGDISDDVGESDSSSNEGE